MQMTADVTGWRQCAKPCGTCSVPSTSKLLKTVKPDRMIEWAHSVLDVAEDLVADPRGLPGSYKFKCDITAVPANFMLPKGAEAYLGSRQHQEELLQHAVNSIEKSLATYSDNRVSLGKSMKKPLTMLSLCDIDDFKRCMTNQLWFSVVHAAIDQISITSTMTIHQYE